MKSRFLPKVLICLCLFFTALACRMFSADKNNNLHPTSFPEIPPATPAKQTALPQIPQILLSTHKDGSVELFAMQSAGSNLTQLTFSDYVSNWHPDWSPDCSKIAYDADTLEKNFPMIYVMKYGDYGSAQMLTNPQQFMTAEEPSWSPDGKKIAFCGRLQNEDYRGIFIINADGSQVELLTEERIDSINTCPAWSPDGKYIAFLSSPQGRTDYLMVMNADGSGLRELYTMKNVTYGCPSWSPDSQRIAFVANDDNITFDIAVINLDGSNFINLTSSKADELEPDWSPDGKFIYYMFREGGSGFQLRGISIDGAEQVTLTDAEVNYHYLDWCSLP